MKKTILVTGASSFVGAHVCQYLSDHCNIIAVWNRTPLRLEKIRSIQVNLLTEEIPAEILDVVDVVIHLAAKIQDEDERSAYEINRLMMRNILNVQKPIIYASSTAVHWKQDVPYVQSRREDEEELRNSGLDYAILRPCAPYGPKLHTHTPKHKESFQTLVQTVQRAPIVPIIGNGHYLRQPLHVQDFAELMRYFIDRGFRTEQWDVAGGSVHSFNEVIAILQRAVGRSQPRIHVPKRLASFGARFVPSLEPSLISVIDNSEAFDIRELQKMTSFRPFTEGVYDLL